MEPEFVASEGSLLTPLVPSPFHYEKLTIDQVLQKWAGEFGPAQLLNFTLASLAWVLHAFLTLAMVFADTTPQWACIAQHGPSAHPSNCTLSLLSAQLDSAEAARNSLCNSSSSICTMDVSLWTWVGGKSQSTISEWGLLCGEDYKITLVQSFFFAGGLAGAGVYGSLSDSILGRKGVLILSSCLGSICGGLTALSPNYWAYFLLRGATGFNCGGIGLSSFLLATEAVGPSKRGMAGMSTFYFFSGGVIWLSALAYSSSSWRYLYLRISVPSFLYCLLVLPFLTESPRWYLIQGRIDDALNVLMCIAKRNRREFPTGINLDTEQYDPAETIVQNCEQSRALFGCNQDIKRQDQVVSSNSSQCSDPTATLQFQTRHVLENYKREKEGVVGDLQDQTAFPYQLESSQRQALRNQINTLYPCFGSRSAEHHECQYQCMEEAQNSDPLMHVRTQEGSPFVKVQVHIENNEHSPNTGLSKATVLDIFRTPATRTRLVNMMLIWLDIAVLYYGINLNAGNLGGSNVYLSLSLNAIAELPAFAITTILLNKFGRRPMLVASLLLTGACSMLGSLVSVTFAEEEKDTGIRLWCGVLAIFGIAASYNLVYIYTAELFPTAVRNAAMGLTSQAAQVGAIASPVTALVGKGHPSLAFAVFGAVSFAGALLALRLPETHNQPMLETLHGLEVGNTKQRKALIREG